MTTSSEARRIVVELGIEQHVRHEAQKAPMLNDSQRRLVRAMLDEYVPLEVKRAA